MREYKIGDKVKIREDLKFLNDKFIIANGIVPSMYQYAGKIAEIIDSNVDVCGDINYTLKIEGENQCYCWTENCFDSSYNVAYNMNKALQQFLEPIKEDLPLANYISNMDLIINVMPLMPDEVIVEYKLPLDKIFNRNIKRKQNLKDIIMATFCCSIKGGLCDMCPFEHDDDLCSSTMNFDKEFTRGEEVSLGNLLNFMDEEE